MTYLADVIALGADHHWNLDEAGSTGVDQIGSLDGTYIGTPTQAGVGPTQVAGSGSMTPHTSGDGLDFASAVGMATSGDMTVHAFVKTSNTTQVGTMIAWGNGGKIDALVNYTGNSRVSMSNGASDDHGVDVSGSLMFDGNWHAVAWRWDDTAKLLEAFVDGVSYGTVAYGSNLGPGTTAMRIGDLFYAGGFWFDGSISNLSTFPSKVADADILALAPGDASGPVSMVASQFGLEALVEGDPAMRASQFGVEALVGPTSQSSWVSQFGLEAVVADADPEMVVSQFGLEVLVPYTAGPVNIMVEPISGEVKIPLPSFTGGPVVVDVPSISGELELPPPAMAPPSTRGSFAVIIL